MLHKWAVDNRGLSWADRWGHVQAVEHGYMQYNVTQTSLEAQMISSINGKIMDQWVLTKPANFKLNATARSAALSSFEPNTSLGSNWLDTYGIDGGVFSNVSLLSSP